jgi:sugar lactone lactonase YvrE
VSTLPATLRFELVPDWEQLPDGYSHPDVTDVATDSQDRVYLLCRTDKPETPDHPVLVYDRDGRFLRSFGEGVISLHPHGITIGPDDMIYITDLDHTVRKLTPDGEVVMTLGSKGVPDDRGGPFNKPSNTAIAPNGDLYVAGGYGQSRIHHFSADGKLIKSWGETGHGAGQIFDPHGIWVDREGRVFEADRSNNRLQIFSPDGEYLDEWTNTQRPNQIFMDADGRVYVGEGSWRPGTRTFQHGAEIQVTEANNEPARVAVFDADGTVLARWGGTHALADACQPGNFASPHGLCVDSQGNIYVAEVTWSVGGKAGHLAPDCKTFQKFRRVAS